MVEETLVDPRQPFFNAVKRLVESLHKKHGPLYLAILMRFKDRPEDEWTLVVGSKPLLQDYLKGVSTVAKCISKTIPKRLARNIRKIGVVQSSDPFVRAVAKAIRIPPVSSVLVANCTFNDIEIHDAVIYVSDLNGKIAPGIAAKKPRTRSSAAR